MLVHIFMDLGHDLRMPLVRVDKKKGLVVKIEFECPLVLRLLKEVPDGSTPMRDYQFRKTISGDDSFINCSVRNRTNQ